MTENPDDRETSPNVNRIPTAPTEGEDLALDDLAKEIETSELRLETLRNAYAKRTGHPPARSLRDPRWRWTIFMVLGFAFISSMVYLLGIGHYGSNVPSGIPSFFYNTEIAYFAILTFYILIMALVVQNDKISGYQAWGLILGFWCSQILIYDWSWWAMEAGLGLLDPSTFWNTPFGTPFLIPNPPMWLFLTEAILGGVMSLYTFTIPDSFRKLFPPALWLYALYGNASICEALLLPFPAILGIGIALVACAFSAAAIFARQRLRGGIPAWLKDWPAFKQKWHPKNWSADPLALPWVVILVGMLVVMHLFLALVPVVGLFIGMLPWFFVPLFFVVWHSSNVQRMTKGKQIGIGIALAAFLAILVIAMAFYAG